VTIEAPDGTRQEQKALLVDREKSRLLTLQLPRKERGEIGGAPPRASAVTEETALARIPTGAWIAGGIGVAAVGTGIVFGLQAKSKYNALNAQCAPVCSPDETKAGHTDAIIADVAFGVGAAGIVGGILWAVLGSKRGPSHAFMPQIGVREAAGGWIATASASY
jgi:hypothetical protein